MVAQSQRLSPTLFQLWWQKYASQVLPPLVGIVVFLALWQGVSSSGLTRLPAPSTLFTDEDTRTLLLNPFFDRGGLDKGLFWQTLASLTRVAKGYLAAAVVGIS